MPWKHETQSQPEYFHRVSQGVFGSDESSLLRLVKLKASGCVISSTHFVVTNLHSTNQARCGSARGKSKMIS